MVGRHHDRAGGSHTLLAVLFGALALAVGAATGSRGLAAGAGAVAAAAAYLLHAVAPMSDTVHPLQRLSPLYWASGNNPLIQGLGPGLLVVAAATLALGDLATALFDRRDLAS